jgi:2-C-methyl-D-erythritol 2,4-cyclodiphosphate synthase
MRIGQGIDVHAFAPSDSSPLKTIMLGGVSVPSERQLLAHSDGDVVLHALCDALLGALALGDIGQHFSDKDSAYKNIDSSILLSKVMTMITDHNYQLVNADLTIVAEQPKIAPFAKPMCQSIAATCNTKLDAISVKATTTEKLGFTGRGEGIACFAVVLLQAS